LGILQSGVLDVTHVAGDGLLQQRCESLSLHEAAQFPPSHVTPSRHAFFPRHSTPASPAEMKTLDWQLFVPEHTISAVSPATALGETFLHVSLALHLISQRCDARQIAPAMHAPLPLSALTPHCTLHRSALQTGGLFAQASSSRQRIAQLPASQATPAWQVAFLLQST
jgi:hypothetical protein